MFQPPEHAGTCRNTERYGHQTPNIYLGAGMEQRYTLSGGDSYAWLRSLPDNSADALITDPPYSSGGAFRSDRSGSTAVKYTSGDNPDPDFHGDNRDGRGFLAWAALWLAESYRVLRDGSPVCLFTDWRQLPTMTDALQAGGFIWRGIAVWDKTEGARPQKGRFTSQCEYVVWGSRGPMPLDRGVGCLPGVLRQMPPAAADRHHQTAKPVEVMEWICRIAAPDSLILDPFAGSGSTGVAALLSGHRFAGCEMSDHYRRVAGERLDAALSGEVIERARPRDPKQGGLFR